MNHIFNVMFLACGSVALTFLGSPSALAQAASNGQATDVPSRLQSRAEIAALPPSSNRNTVRAGFRPNGTPTNSQFGGGGSAYQSAWAQADVYPYPATGRTPRIALQSNGAALRPSNVALPRRLPNPQNASQLSIGTNSTIKSRPNVASQSSFAVPVGVSQQTTGQTVVFRQPIYQASTLGLGGTPVRMTQTCYCLPSYNSAAVANRTTVGYQTAAPSSATGSGLSAPPLNVQVPGQPNNSSANGQTALQPSYPYPPSAAPQNPVQANRWGMPFVTGSGAYPAAIRRQNMPVGSYLGQGFVGQPTAYVDGQPIRNLLRYITP